MKRKDMIKKLVKVLKNWEDCPLDGMVANDILDAIEYYGMLPPEIKNPKYMYSDVLNYWSEHPFLEYPLKENINEWEDDEEDIR